MSVVWPRKVLIPRNAAVDAAPQTLAGPPALSGFRQTIASPAAVWLITYEQIPVVTAAARLCWRALQALIEGRATQIILPVWDRDELKPLALLDDAPSPHSDGAYFSDGSGYLTWRSHVVLTASIIRGATQLSCQRIAGPALQPGQHFSIADRLYRVARIISESGSTATLTIWPPAREAANTGAVLNFDHPRATVRLVEDKGLDLNLSLGRNAAPTVRFIEDPY